MFGNNKSVVDSASIPTSTVPKKSTLASYHIVREPIAAGYLQFNCKEGKVKLCRHPEETSGIFKYLASLEAPTFLEGRYK